MHFLLCEIFHETAFWLKDLKKMIIIDNKITQKILPSSSQTSIAEILVKVGLMVPILVGMPVEETGRLLAPFPKGTGLTTGLTGIT